jgi:hypothetical protein
MNPWIKKSIELANAHGYLDRLHNVYPVTTALERPLSSETKEELKDAFQKKDKLRLLKILLRLEKFPIKDPYVAFLRRNKGQFIEKNPQTVQRIANKILSMEFDEVIAGVEEPKEFNRQIGTLFKKWLPKLPYHLLDPTKFEKHSGVALLQGSDAELMEYANTILKCNLQKAPDLLAKVGNNFVLGEAKFLTDYGGHQNAQFQDALTLLRGTQGKATRIAILDGVVWIQGKAKMFKTVSQLKKTALTALLLKEFLEDLTSRH